MALSDSAVARFQKKASTLNVYDDAVGRILLNISEIPCYLVNKLLKQRSTLTVFRDT